jgi:twinkle protein
MIKVTGYISGVKYSEDILEKNGKQKCPVCAQVGKQNVKDTPLSVNLQRQLFKCHKCSWSGGWGEFKKPDYVTEKTYVVPDIGNQTELSDKHLQGFSKRMITQEVLIRNKVKSSTINKDWFSFTYYNGEEPVKVKGKTLPDKEGKKKLMQSKDSKPWIYKYNDLVDQKEVMVCEGEEEALIWEVAGFKAACSVDMGAPNVNDENADGKLQCITNCFDVFEDSEVIYLAVDEDPNGKRLEKELIRRFGAEKCKIVDFSPCKDANEYALKFGTAKLIDQKNNAKDVQVEGVFTADQFYDAIISNYRNGQPRGTTTYFPQIDNCWTWRLGEVNVWTGYNNEGKSMLLKQLQICKSIGEGWKHAIFSPEEWPLDEWYTDLMESYIGKSMDSTQQKYYNYANIEEVKDSHVFTNKHFYNIYPDEDHSIDEILKLFSYTVRKYDIKTVTLDPYNQVHHRMQPGEREDLYISRFMSKLKRFAIEHMISFNLVAHQATPPVQEGQNYPEPNLFRIKGGGTFADKADNVLAVWRENRNTNKSCKLVKFISQKIKKQKLTGEPGAAQVKFDRAKNMYSDLFDTFPIETLKNSQVENMQQEFPEVLINDNLKEFQDEFNQLPDEEIPF